ncbi:MAG: hypothetical protein LBC09_04210, partial [Helicobacteraceae bacterium]|nr:hypothetical protein [Helicobacteraceae bacterium]
MGYVNEWISAEDWEKYDFNAINKRRAIRGGADRYWAIDRDREIWVKLYLVSRDIDYDTEIRTYWDFYWKGGLVPIETKALKRSRSEDGVLYGYIKILELEIPENILRHKSEILQEFKAAIEASFL